MSTIDQYFTIEKKTNTNNFKQNTHQRDISPVHRTLSTDQEKKMLMQFDFTSKFGPSMGLTREERFQRAELLGLNPPQQVKQIINKYRDETDFFENYNNNTLEKTFKNGELI
ncbi:hypothetical protein PPERSA_12344 [Pseudocohnilembus persalinus]|uniref:Uncharacterized protein n=1 Tax=Pseudocohnilembus persalinus TaxID=266149 RepID=A0A0V0R1F9_PSEPJ|nr:hypothetical protein PPERSA_12344 [Pseudocohnilembus persalinus]|eukprot:KRX08189.1 hypothetical protein PPERSA_12344 [Pseudocohnilembus persalinus]